MQTYTQTPLCAFCAAIRANFGGAFRRQEVRLGTAILALLALACRYYQALQKLNLVTSLRRPKHLSLGLIYIFMVVFAFQSRLERILLQ